MNNNLNFSNNYFRNNNSSYTNKPSNIKVDNNDFNNHENQPNHNKPKKKNKEMDSKTILIIMIVIIVGVFIYIFLNGDKTTNTTVEHNIIMETTESNVSINSTILLRAYVENNPLATITWYSNNDKIATVDQNGLVKGIDYGETLIYASYTNENNENKTCSCKVKVGSGNKDVTLESVNFPDGEVVIKKGDTYTIPYTLNPSNGYLTSISYTSSNTSVATIDNNGLLKAISTGTTTINLKANNSFTSSININVIDTDITPQIIVLPTTLSFKEKEITILEGKTKNIELNYEPSNAKVSNLTYTSTNESVCYINGTNIVAVKAGTCNVKVSSLNGLVDVATVTVTSTKVDVTNLAIQSSTTVSIKVGETSTILYKVEPTDATDKSVTFTSSNTSVATVSSSGVITGVSAGTTTIKVTTNDQNKESTIVVNVTKDEGSSTCDTGSSDLVKSLTPLTSLGTESGYQSCRDSSPNLSVSINGTTYYQDSTYEMKVGDKIIATVYLPTKCGGILRLTRTSADGESGWSTYFSMKSNPYVNRCDYTTYQRVTSYNWEITAKKATSGYVILSQTAQFDVKSANSNYGNIKSMMRLRVKVTN